MRRSEIAHLAVTLSAFGLVLNGDTPGRRATDEFIPPCESGMTERERQSRIIRSVVREADRNGIHGNPDLTGCTVEEIRSARAEWERKDDERRRNRWLPLPDGIIVSAPSYVFGREEEQARNANIAEAE